MRGRGRKGSNVFNKNLESNGPDVKIRGTPSQIAEKYHQLARDAASSGDNVMSENYYQHAEHYLRLLAVSQPQQAQRLFGARSGDGNDDDETDQPIASAQPIARRVNDEDAPQPFLDALPDFMTGDVEARMNGHKHPGSEDSSVTRDGEVDAPETGKPKPRRHRRTETKAKTGAATREVGAEKFETHEGADTAPRRRGRRPRAATPTSLEASDERR